MDDRPTPFGAGSNFRCGLFRCAPRKNRAQPGVSDRGRHHLRFDDRQCPPLWWQEDLEGTETLTMGSSQRRCRAVALVAVLLFVGSCGEPDLWSDRGVRALVERTRPPGATLVSFSPPTRNKSGIWAEWEVATGMTWNAYVPWVRGQLRKDFSAEPDTRSPLLFRRALPADVVILQVERLPSGPALHVRVTFSAAPF